MTYLPINTLLSILVPSEKCKSSAGSIYAAPDHDTSTTTLDRRHYKLVFCFSPGCHLEIIRAQNRVSVIHVSVFSSIAKWRGLSYAWSLQQASICDNTPCRPLWCSVWHMVWQTDPPILWHSWHHHECQHVLCHTEVGWRMSWNWAGQDSILEMPAKGTSKTTTALIYAHLHIFVASFNGRCPKKVKAE